MHAYEDHVFITAQSPYLGRAGHVHLLELDQIIGHHYLVTVHGPINPDLDVSVALVETTGVLARLESGRFRPKTPAELSYAVTSAVARRQRAAIGEVSMKLPGLENEVMSSKLTDPERLLETMFLIRHELITTRTMAAQCHDVWMRLAGINRMADDVDGAYARDVADQFDRIRSLADGESQFLFGVIELYQTKVHTKMTVAMERLAVIAAVTLPVTALASVYGMNVIVNDSTHWVQLVVVLARDGDDQLDAARLGPPPGLVVTGGLPRWSRARGPQHPVAGAVRVLDGDRLRHRRDHLLHPDHHDPVRHRVVPDRQLRAVAVRSHDRAPTDARARPRSSATSSGSCSPACGWPSGTWSPGSRCASRSSASRSASPASR